MGQGEALALFSRATRSKREQLQAQAEAEAEAIIAKIMAGESKNAFSLTSETPTGQSCLAYCLAALVLLSMVAINTLFIPTDSQSLNISSTIDFFLAAALFEYQQAQDPILLWYRQHQQPFYRWQRRLERIFDRYKLPPAWERNLTLFRAVLGALLWPIVAFAGNSAINAIVISLIQLGCSGSLILLLTGRSKTWRMILAMGIFGVFLLGAHSLPALLMPLAYLMGDR